MRRLLAILALGAAMSAGSAAAAPNPANQAALDRTVRFLQEAQNGDGGFAGAAGGASGSMFSAWVALALAAAGINPQDQVKPGGGDVHSYLVGHYLEGVVESDCGQVVCTTTLERELMVVNASGTSPHDFGGVDLAAQLLERADEEGAFPHVPGGVPGVNDTIFAIFALAPIQEPAAQGSIQPAADWIERQQKADGGWAWGVDSSRDEVDMTGAAIQALVAAGRGRNASVEKGLQYLRQAQSPEGGFPEYPGTPEANVASTAWAVQAIWAAGENPETWRTAAGTEPLAYLESLQEPDGHVRWKRNQDLNGIWMTAYVTPALAGQAWPIPAPPRALPALAESVSDVGVIAGGGGRGAPLFSRPKPQSRGRTPGGTRVLRSHDPVDHSSNRRGANRVQSGATAELEAPGAGPSGTAAAVPMTGNGNGRGAGGEAEAGGGAADAEVGTGSSSSARRADSGELGEEVTGVLVGERTGAVIGAPGLRGGSGEDQGPGVALGIGAAALLIGLGGAAVERRRVGALVGAGA